MSASQERQPTLDSIAPRSLVADMEQALAFYGQLGFVTTYHDEGFAIVERDGVAQYVPTGALQSPLQVQPRGMKEFCLRDPNRNLLIFGERIPVTSSQPGQPTLLSISPRVPVADMEQALAFYAQLGFATTDRDGEFVVVERDGISLHFHVSEGHRVCWIGVTNIEALYQQYVPTGAIQSPQVRSQPWGMKEFFLCDPFRNLLLFGESIPEEESSTQQGA